MSLTPHSIRAITDNIVLPNHPVLQVIDIKAIQGQAQTGQERYRLIISDGEFYQQAMLATQLNHLVHQNLKQYCIIRLLESVCNPCAGKKYDQYARHDFVVSPPTNSAIGSPQSLDNAGVKFDPGAPQAPQEQHQQRFGGQQPSTSTGGGWNTSGPVGGSYKPEHENTTPICALHPYSNKFTIKARITNRSDVRTWSNERGQGKVFSIDLCDAQGGEIRATLFNDAVDRFHTMLEPNKVYLFSNVKVRFVKNAKFNPFNTPYELGIDIDSVIQRADEDTTIPRIKYNFCPVDQLREHIGTDTNVDVLGIVIHCGDLQNVSVKGKDVSKRTVTVMDETNYSIDVTLWRTPAEAADFHVGDIIAVKGCKISDFNTCSLNSVSSTSIERNPDRREAHKLRGWYEANKDHLNPVALSSSSGGGGGGDGKQHTARKTANDITAACSDQAQYYEFVGMLTSIKPETPWYDACDNMLDGRPCNKKLFRQGDTYRCERCDKTFHEPCRRFILQLKAGDHTGVLWLNCFDEVGQKLFGHTANEMSKMAESDPKAVSKIFGESSFKTYIFKVRSKIETYNEEQKPRINVMSCNTIDYAAESRNLIQEINQYSMI